MSLLEYGRLLIQRGWIVVLCAAVFMGAAYLYSARQTPIYRSTQNMLVVPDKTDANVDLATRRQLNAYVQYLYSSLVGQEISDSLQLGVSGAELRGRAEISAVPDRSLIIIEVNDLDGEAANRVAYAWGQKLVEYRNRLNENLPEGERVSALPQDNPVFRLYWPRLGVNLGLGGFVGAVLGCLIVFFVELRRNSIVRHREDIEGFNDLPVLATIPTE